MIKKIIALVFILLCTSVAWMILSVTMQVRTDEKSNTMSDAVGNLWGDRHHQAAPLVKVSWVVEKKVEMAKEEKLNYIKNKFEEEKVSAKMERRKRRVVKVSDDEFIKTIKERHQRVVELSGSEIEVDLRLDYRKKGLLWFSTYTVEFTSQYRIENPVDQEVEATMEFPFSSYRAVYDNMKIEAPGREDVEYTTVTGDRGASRMVANFSMEANSSRIIRFKYRSRGLDQWTYQFGENVQIVKNFKLTMRTDFNDIDFPRESISPDKKERLAGGDGWVLTWEKESLVSAFQIGMIMPHRLNPGPLAAAMSRTSPVSLLFFFFVIFTLQLLQGIKIHHMNYFFLACGFFAFNLLFSYLVDHVDIRASFAIASVASIFLVVSYLKLAVGTRFAMVEAGLSQFVYQILFAFAHFFKGYTGLAITIGAIMTLAVVMRLTAKIDWEEKFKETDWGGWPGRKKTIINNNMSVRTEPPPLPGEM